MRFQGENQVFGKAIIFQKYNLPRCARRIWNPLLFDPAAVLASINAGTHVRRESYTLAGKRPHSEAFSGVFGRRVCPPSEMYSAVCAALSDGPIIIQREGGSGCGGNYG